MGAGAGGYVTIQLLTFDNTLDSASGKLSRKSQLLFTPAVTPTRDKNKDNFRPLPPIPKDSTGKDLTGPVPGSPPAGKVALGGLRQTEVTKFNLYAYTDKQLTTLVGMGTAPSETIGAEAHEAFIGPLTPGQKPMWAGFAVALGPSGGRFDLIADIELLPSSWSTQKAYKPFQVIPVVVAFGTDSFVNHYLLSLIVAQKTEDLVDTTVTQPYR